MTEQEKIDHLSKDFNRLNEDEKDYLQNISNFLFYIQNPLVPPSLSKKREYRKQEKTAD
ncbi:hypothetical protein AGMMS49942_05320 [Spirochaetia bacterium]|nr:hypothetical protein AGMMS49942_05320 [Spirochaetia bacterium]